MKGGYLAVWPNEGPVAYTVPQSRNVVSHKGSYTSHTIYRHTPQKDERGVCLLNGWSMFANYGQVALREHCERIACVRV